MIIRLFLFIGAIIGCESTPRNQSASQDEQKLASDKKISITAIDTASPVALISLAHQEKLDSLEKYDRKKYAQKRLKEFAYCSCLKKAFDADTVVMAKDNSKWLAFELTIHSRGVIDSISKRTTEFVDWAKQTTNPFNVKNYSSFCLEFYESRFLDSLVKSYDNKIRNK